MTIDGIVASSELLGLALLLVLFAMGLRNRSYLREIATDPDPGWQRMARLAALQLVVFIIWTSVFDNWRQLTGIPFRAIKQFPSERVLIDPPSHAVRTVTFILLAITLIIFGALLARHIGGYFMQFTIAAGALVAWLPFYVIRQRFSLNLALGFTGSWTSPFDVGAYLSFVLITYLFDIGLILVTFFTLLGAVALPVTLFLDLAHKRRPRVTDEAKPFFSSIGDRAGSVRNV